LAILAQIMLEAKSRGLTETDFPQSHQAIRDDLLGHYHLDDDDMETIAKTLPPEILQ